MDFSPPGPQMDCCYALIMNYVTLLTFKKALPSNQDPNNSSLLMFHNKTMKVLSGYCDQWRVRAARKLPVVLPAQVSWDPWSNLEFPDASLHMARGSSASAAHRTVEYQAFPGHKAGRGAFFFFCGIFYLKCRFAFLSEPSKQRGNL